MNTHPALGLAALFLAAALPLASWAKDAPSAQPVSPPAVQAGSPEKKSAAPPDESMRMYVLGLLYRGEKWTPEKTEETAKIQEAHLANIGRLAKEGKLILAGPFSGGDDLRGLFLFNVTTIEEARALADTDPAVQAGRLRVDLIQWYGPKGIRYDGMPGSD
jgi:uncharacterized protein YciI